MGKINAVIAFCVLLVKVTKAGLPDYLEPLVCKATDPNYEKCFLTGFAKMQPLLLKGIPEVNLPPMDPFVLPIMVINRTSSNDLVKINATVRNIRVEGARNLQVNGLKLEPAKHRGEIRLTLPWTYVEMEYDVTGRLLTLPLQSKGFFRGNFTNTQMYIKSSLETYTRDKEEYYRVRKVNTKIVIGDAWIKLVAKNPSLQFAADAIANFVNQDTRTVLDAIAPLVADTTNQLIRVVGSQILATVKATDWLPS